MRSPLVLALAGAALANGAPAVQREFVLASQVQAAPVFVDSAGDRAVLRATGDFVSDIGRVTGVVPPIVSDLSHLKGEVVIVGVLGRSPVIDRLVADGRLDARGIQGEWESTVTAVVADPLPSVSRALIVAGSDRRGVIYGLYRISETIGVSPWNWWADVPVRKRPEAFVAGDTLKQGPPAVKYRGIFLNDEDWGLRPWASQTLDPQTGNIGPKTYARVFELLLRLHANYLWPAMHPGTRAFNHYPDDKTLADEYGIVMGSSHAEPMLRDNIDEWKREGRGDYNFVTNGPAVLSYWEDRVRSNAPYENVYTMGMRGIDDTGMPGAGTLDEKAVRLRQIITDQREMLRRWVGPDPARIPQIFCPYKEVLDIYRRDPSIIPPDITLVWPDDNFGFVRQYSNAREQLRPGGAGVYYHVSYWGRPYDYLWVCSTPPAQIAEEMSKAWERGARTVWMLNVGDLKPAELDMEFFLRLAWDPRRWSLGRAQDDFLTQWARRDFSESVSESISSILNDYYRLNFARKPEHMGVDPKSRYLSHPVFSVSENDDEAGRRLEAFAVLNSRATDVMNSLPKESRDAYYELVLYPVRAAYLANAKGLSLARYLDYASAGRACASVYLDKAREAQAKIDAETEYYNSGVAGGKWRGMMSDAPRALAVFGLPGYTPPPVPAVPSLGVEAGGDVGAVLPQFSALDRKDHYMDVFGKGRTPVSWNASSSEKWIRLSRTEGVGDQRIVVGIAWDRAPKGINIRGSILVAGGAQSIEVQVNLYNPADVAAPRQADFAEEGGRLIFQAVHASMRTGPWVRIGGLGYAGEALALAPSNPTPRPLPVGRLARPAEIEFAVWLQEAGNWKISVRSLPTWPMEQGHPATYSLAIDDGSPVKVSLPNYTDEMDPQWQEDVLRNAAIASCAQRIATPGLHRVKLWCSYPGIVLDSIMMEREGAESAGYTWLPETRIAK